MAIAEGIAAAKLALDVSKVALDELRHPKVDWEAVRNRLIEMQDLVISTQRSLAEAEDENRQLKRKLEDRESLKALEADMNFVIDGGFFVRKSESDKGVIAYCPLCWKKDTLAIPLETAELPGWFRCSIHDTIYQTAHCRAVAKRMGLL